MFAVSIVFDGSNMDAGGLKGLQVHKDSLLSCDVLAMPLLLI